MSFKLVSFLHLLTG